MVRAYGSARGDGMTTAGCYLGVWYDVLAAGLFVLVALYAVGCLSYVAGARQHARRVRVNRRLHGATTKGI